MTGLFTLLGGSFVSGGSGHGYRSVELACGHLGSCGSGLRLCAELGCVGTVRHGVYSQDRKHYQAAYKRPGGFFKEAVGLADTHYGTCAAELRRKAAAFGFLNEDNADEKHGNDYGQDDYDCVHGLFVIFLMRRGF